VTCPCEGKNGLDLVLCLAPPEGEYETEIRVSDNMAIVANRRGLFVRRTVTDDFLPFIRTVMRRITRGDTLRAYGVSLERILCENIRGLRDASRHGSRIASRILEECEDIIREIDAACSEST